MSISLPKHVYHNNKFLVHVLKSYHSLTSTEFELVFVCHATPQTSNQLSWFTVHYEPHPRTSGVANFPVK